jgi:lactoylglutathione lyase
MQKIDYVIVLVSDMKRSVEFYRDVLGLPLKFESPFWTEFATEGATLALHPTQTPAPAETSPIRNQAGTCQPGFHVGSLDAFHAAMLSKGVRCLEPPRPLEGGGRLAVYADPDGLPISIAERPKSSG